ncbi:D-erythronate dehydrogenase [Aestuariivirga litoralis]|uniref:D-erythronate dehydrogenase n=1 Tax=Aestuariivirga litoralis TaxID=2650924 RepID=UPI0018C656AC|nr:D-erythronate dehydrogenase [Aestuariivirga litoralis]MBG1232182.1 SDR family oxidoreductase [Aestuariivirga litoralis]
MRILITGAAGMIGRKLVTRLLKDGKLRGQAIKAIELVDVVAAEWPHSTITLNAHVGDLAEPDFVEKLVATKPDAIFHLAGIVSGEAEANFELGYRVNMDGGRLLFEGLRKAKQTPRVVFTSSIAVFGAPFPAVIPDDFHLTPLTSYGAQKAMEELLLADYTRKGFFDGIGIRLPTICVRPGKPNKAASGFFSNIIREPLVGVEAVLPVPRDVVHTHASPSSAIGFLIHAAEIDGKLVGPRRNLTMPGVGVSVQEQIDSLRRIAGDKVVALIKEVPDQTIGTIVSGWPTRFEAKRSRDLGFVAEKNFDEIIQAHINAELGGKLSA